MESEDYTIDGSGDQWRSGDPKRVSPGVGWQGPLSIYNITNRIEKKRIPDTIR